MVASQIHSWLKPSGYVCSGERHGASRRLLAVYTPAPCGSLFQVSGHTGRASGTHHFRANSVGHAGVACSEFAGNIVVVRSAHHGVAERSTAIGRHTSWKRQRVGHVHSINTLVCAASLDQNRQVLMSAHQQNTRIRCGHLVSSTARVRHAALRAATPPVVNFSAVTDDAASLSTVATRTNCSSVSSEKIGSDRTSSAARLLSGKSSGL